MSDRLSRKEIKQRDRFQEWMVSAIAFVEDNGRKILYGVLAVLAAVALVVAGRFFLGQRAETAQRLLAEAIEVYSAPIDAENPTPDDPESMSFSDEGSRTAAAQTKLQAITDRYGSTVAGSVARVYLGRISSQAGDLETARTMWESFLADDAGDMLSSEVELNLITLDRQEGKDEEVAERLESMLESGRATMPQDVILFELAETLDTLGRTDEATPYYQRILDEHPRSPFNILAQQRVSERAASVTVPLPS